MAYCSNCGGQVAEGVRFCPQCGREVAVAGAAPVTPAVVSTGAGLDRNVAGALAYVLGLITGILFLVLEPYSKDPFIRFHAYQSIFFNIAAILISVVFGIMPIINILAPFGLLAVWIILMIKAYQGQQWKLPVIGDLAAKQK